MHPRIIPIFSSLPLAPGPPAIAAPAPKTSATNQTNSICFVLGRASRSNHVWVICKSVAADSNPKSRPREADCCCVDRHRRGALAKLGLRKLAFYLGVRVRFLYTRRSLSVRPLCSLTSRCCCKLRNPKIRRLLSQWLGQTQFGKPLAAQHQCGHSSFSGRHLVHRDRVRNRSYFGFFCVCCGLLDAPYDLVATGWPDRSVSEDQMIFVTGRVATLIQDTGGLIVGCFTTRLKSTKSMAKRRSRSMRSKSSLITRIC
jgi:hypothetical protein